ncbi:MULTISPECIES: hypothetical protein [Protofrankia]|uniref:Uncharacterized protein n=1 Tax=Protofrankia coriariae TaxID=1562887 RepID=A0ABR5EZI4_9ACTN|nr:MULTISPECIES: hypothetical protein [Protofrankia]KLL09876.1 hypothetical protein FrCorBMG51_21845 [Protofrankia coriariae]ONH34200.1 hypothetical protein BL254_17565 [Protofrankia sp. BMG5.30]
MPMTPTLAVATDFIASHATEQDLTRISATVKQRRAALAAIRTASLTTGTPVRITTVKPRSLDGLTGTIGQIDGKHATIILDAASTDRLRVTPTNLRFLVPTGAISVDLHGVPLRCCLPT